MKSVTTLFYVLIFFFIAEISHSQITTEWTSTYNSVSNGNDEVLSMTVDNSGNVFVTGFSVTTGGDKDIITVKYNSAGTEQWATKFNNADVNGDDEGTSIDVDAFGNSYVTGYSTGNGTFKDYVTIKYSSAGNILWTARYNGSGNDDDISSAIKVTPAGNVYITGSSVGNGSSEDYVTIKYNTSGAQQWVSVYNNDVVNDIDIANSITIDNSENVYVSGFSYGNSKNEDYATVKYNSSGAEQWVSRFNGASDSFDISEGIAVDNSGNVYVTGYSYDSLSSEDYLTIKYNSSGTEQWISRFNGTGNSFDITSGIAVDNSGNVFVTGYSYDNSTFEDYATVKYNSDGVQQWVSEYNGEGSDFDIAVALKLDGSGNVYVTGYSFGNGTAEDYATVKYNSDGILQWTEIYNGSQDGSDVAMALFVDLSGNVYTSGYSYNSATAFDFVTIKYSPTVGISNVSLSAPDKFELQQNYPNPFNPSTSINYNLPSDNFVTLKIYDINGKEAATLVNGRQSRGSYSAKWNASGFSSGIYFYKLETGKFAETKRMMLIK